jgi:hypothetical protein
VILPLLFLRSLAKELLTGIAFTKTQPRTLVSRMMPTTD